MGRPPEPGPWTIAATGRPQIDLDDRALFASAHLIRETERLLLRLYAQGHVRGTIHTCLGQELTQISVVRALDQVGDFVLSNHRNHGHFLAWTGDVYGLVAEIAGRADGVCGGRGGSQHLAAEGFHASGVQGGLTAIGVGLAMAARDATPGALGAVMLGDGTLGQGLLYESLNLAGILGAPLLFVIEHNGIAQTTRTADTTAGSVTARGAAFGLPTARLSDRDPDFPRACAAFVRQVRESGGPALLVIDTHRMGPHSKGDDPRPAEEKAEIEAGDPLRALGARVPDRAEIEAENFARLERVTRQVLAAPHPTVEEAVTDPFADTPAPVAASGQSGQTVRLQLHHALKALLADDPWVVLLGEDLHAPIGGAFRITGDLSERYPDRVLSTPISEAGVVGAAIGLALSGRRPVVEIMFADFLTLAADQLYNHAVKFASVYPGARVPLVVRTPCGGHRGYGPTHSQSPLQLFTGMPGLAVVYGSHRHDVGALLIEAVAWQHPTIFFEHKLLYGRSQDRVDYAALPTSGDVGADRFPTLFRASPDPDLVIVSTAGMLPAVEDVAASLREHEELSVEIIAPSLLSPMPFRGMLPRLQRAPRVLVCEESPTPHGFGAELLARLVEAGFRGQVRRVGAAPAPIPAAEALELAVLPHAETIMDAAIALFD